MTEKTKMFVSGAAVGGLVVGLIVAGVFLFLDSGDALKKEQDFDPKKKAMDEDEAETMRKQKVEAQAGDAPQKESYFNREEQSVNDKFPLRLGSRGPKVERVQVWLLRNFGLGGQVTGVFDEKTRDRVFRALNTEEVDSNTFNRLGMNKPVHQQPSFR